MDSVSIASSAVAGFLAIYLVVALMKPEWFS